MGLAQSTNKKIRNDPPSSVAAREDFKSTTLGLHWIKLSDLKADDYEDFLKSRLGEVSAFLAGKFPWLTIFTEQVAPEGD